MAIEWENASTDSVELYHFMNASITALIFRRRIYKQGYFAYVETPYLHQSSTEAFSTLAEAEAWVEYTLASIQPPVRVRVVGEEYQPSTQWKVMRQQN